MCDANRMQRLKELMLKYGKQKKRSKSVIDTRPASGMVGQKNCEGYMPDESGRLIRIENDVVSDNLGPGSYDPIMPTLTRKVRISSASRMSLENRNVKPGPCDYFHPQVKKNKKTMKDILINYHKTDLITHQEYSTFTPPQTPVAYSDQPKWASSNSSLDDAELYRKFPIYIKGKYKYKFKTDLTSKEFESGSTRELWPKMMKTPSPTSHAPQKEEVYFENSKSPAFADQAERFSISGSLTPCSTAYTMPEVFGKHNSKKIYPPVESKRPPPQPTPDAATYAPDIINRPNTTHQTPVFLTKKDRFEDNSYQTPSCTKYNLTRETLKNVPKVKIRSKIQRPLSEWDVIPQSYSPAVGSYSPDQGLKPKNGYISSTGRKTYDVKADRPLAFNTQHSSFIRKSFNARYANVGQNND
ncbi:hypothetical protein M9Y10_029002 [Tritrichomonas musculus]|uniref:Uncharacterized protein n=1 Tax=Tritrichomonas musculus TaxID=1915356 RepID=A0ABR2KMY9_9EUKA